MTFLRVAKLPAVAVLLFAVLALAPAGCATRSISDSGYGYGYGSDSPLYRGELTEFDVLGIDPGQPVTQEEIRNAFDARQRPTVPKGSPVLLVQSGAMIPDETMVAAMGRYYVVSAFSGVPTKPRGQTFANSIRLAAARGGCAKIIAYWGVLETARKDLGTKIVSWVPILGPAIPDESQEMRIRLKVAVVDVRSGSWEMFSPPPFGDTSVNSSFTRESSDQSQVAVLKSQAYEAAVESLVRRFAR